MASAVSIKILHGPQHTLKDAFSGAVSQGPTAKTIPTKIFRGKKCTAHFGIANMAVSQEQSGTLYCREHRPKQVPVALLKHADKNFLAKENSLVSFFTHLCESTMELQLIFTISEMFICSIIYMLNKLLYVDYYPSMDI